MRPEIRGTWDCLRGRESLWLLTRVPEGLRLFSVAKILLKFSRSGVFDCTTEGRAIGGTWSDFVGLGGTRVWGPSSVKFRVRGLRLRVQGLRMRGQGSRVEG
eukprot:1572885-Rhodomonas_salina.1